MADSSDNWCYSDNDDDITTCYETAIGAEMHIVCPKAEPDVFYVDSVSVKQDEDAPACIEHAVSMAERCGHSTVKVVSTFLMDDDDVDSSGDNENEEGAQAAHAVWMSRLGFQLEPPPTAEDEERCWTKTLKRVV